MSLDAPQLPVSDVETPATVEVRQRVAAPLDQVWKACASASGLMNWQADQARGEARRGGTLTLTWAAFGARVELDVVDLIPYQRLVLRHDASLVEFHFDDGLVTLRHYGPEAGDDAEGLRSSWQLALAQLAHSVERHPGRQRRVDWLVRGMACSPEAAHLCFTDEHLLRRWLTDDGVIDPGRSDYRLTMKSGTVLSGKILTCIPGRDVAVTCDAHGEALLTMRTLPAPGLPGRRLVALAWSAWGRPRADAEEMRDDLTDAMLRLGSVLDGCASA